MSTERDLGDMRWVELAHGNIHLWASAGRSF